MSGIHVLPRIVDQGLPLVHFSGNPIGDLSNDGVTNGADFNVLKGNFCTAGSGVNPLIRDGMVCS